MNVQENRLYLLKTEPGIHTMSGWVTAVYRDGGFLACHRAKHGLGYNMFPREVTEPFAELSVSMVPGFVPHATSSQFL